MWTVWINGNTARTILTVLRSSRSFSRRKLRTLIESYFFRFHSELRYFWTLEKYARLKPTLFATTRIYVFHRIFSITLSKLLLLLLFFFFFFFLFEAKRHEHGNDFIAGMRWTRCCCFQLFRNDRRQKGGPIFYARQWCFNLFFFFSFPILSRMGIA